MQTGTRQFPCLIFGGGGCEGYKYKVNSISVDFPVADEDEDMESNQLHQIGVLVALATRGTQQDGYDVASQQDCSVFQIHSSDQFKSMPRTSATKSRIKVHYFWIIYGPVAVPFTMFTPRPVKACTTTLKRSVLKEKQKTSPRECNLMHFQNIKLVHLGRMLGLCVCGWLVVWLVCL